MKSTRERMTNTAIGILLVAVGALAGGWWGLRTVEQEPGPPAASGSEERKVLYWYDPMSPQHHFDRPGKSPFMDMELVPKYANEAEAEGAAADAVVIDAQITQNIGMREAVVERIALKSVIEASGLLAYNERDVTLEQALSAGLVERVWPLAPGDIVEAGQPLVELRVPQWSAAQAEFLVLRESADTALVDAARERLRQLGMSVQAISELESTGRARQSFVVTSSRAGVLESLDVRNGMAVQAGQLLARVQGIDTVWLEVAVPESHAPAVRVGSEAEVQLTAYPGQRLSGRITAVLPTLAAGSRTLRVRIELPNPRGDLRPGMSAQVRLESNDGGFALAVPTEAIVRTGKRTLLITAQEEGRFAPIEVEVGREIDNRTVITAGVHEGQRVVASAQFLLDSEASLSGISPRALDSPGGEMHHAEEPSGAQP